MNCRRQSFLVDVVARHFAGDEKLVVVLGDNIFERAHETEIAEWAKAHPGQFGYNGIKGGASGVSFVMGWVYAFSGSDAQFRRT